DGGQRTGRFRRAAAKLVHGRNRARSAASGGAREWQAKSIRKGGSGFLTMKRCATSTKQRGKFTAIRSFHRCPTGYILAALRITTLARARVGQSSRIREPSTFTRHGWQNPENGSIS